MRLGQRPAGEAVRDLLREHAFELGSDLLGADEHDGLRGQLPDAQVERVGDLAQVLPDDVLDVPLVPGLRPAALIVPAGHLARFVGNLDELGAAQAKDLPPLTADSRDQRPVPTDERSQRSQIELARDRHVVDAPAWERERAPEVVERCREDDDATGAVPLEAVVEPLPNPPEIRLERLPLVVRQRGLPLLGEALRLRKLRIDPRLGRRRGSGCRSARG